MIRIIVDKVRTLGIDDELVESVRDYTAALGDGELIRNPPC